MATRTFAADIDDTCFCMLCKSEKEGKGVFISYEVDGFGLQNAGPFAAIEAAAQAKDIKGYEGITNVTVYKQE